MEYAILFLPLLGALTGYYGKFLGSLFSEIITTLLVSLSAILSIIVFYEGWQYNYYENHLIFEWISSGNFKANWSINFDPLTSVMFVTVTSISAASPPKPKTPPLPGFKTLISTSSLFSPSFSRADFVASSTVLPVYF